MLDKIHSFIDAFFDIVINIANWFFDQFLILISNIVFVILDVFLVIIESIITGIDMAELAVLQQFDKWSLLPPQVIWILNYLNFAQCLTIVGAAILIRKLLDIIPAAFTRV